MKTLRANHVCSIRYVCRDIGYGIERGTVYGFWTGANVRPAGLTPAPLTRREGVKP